MKHSIQQPRRVPVGLKDDLRKLLDKILENNVTTKEEDYTERTSNVVLIQKPLILPGRIRFTIWSHQDGTGSYYARVVIDFFSETFPYRWIGRRGWIKWPARSPVLTSTDFFPLKLLKGSIHKPISLENLKEVIRNEIQRTTPENITVCFRTCEPWSKVVFTWHFVNSSCWRSVRWKHH